MPHLSILILVVLVGSVLAQDLEPRAYSPSPVGTTFVGVGFGRSSGGVFSDPSLPITNIHADLYSTSLGIGQTFGIFDRQALITAALPYVWGNVSGQVQEARGSISRSGLADVRIRFSLNLRGSPALSPKQFATVRRRGLIVGTSLSVSAPSGQYDDTKLINLGTNRWAFKPEVGLSYPWRRFYFDVYAGASIFTDNARLFPGTGNRSQDVLTSVQAHVSYTIRRSLWCAIDSTWYGGGATRVDQGPPSPRQSNTRIGATLSLPLVDHQSLKLAYSSGVTQSIGTKFTTVSASWQYVWFDHR